MVAPISFINTASYNKYKQHSTQNKSNVSFGARDEYEKLLISSRHDPRTSLFFRYQNDRPFNIVKNTIEEIFKKIHHPKMLIVGVGRGQEPFSYMAVIREILKKDPVYANKSLDSVVDLNCVDLQPKISDAELKSASRVMAFNTSPSTNAPSCFNRDLFGNYEVIPEIFNYVRKIFNNPAKSKWNTLIQDFAAKCKPESYHIISMNNVLMYIDDVNAKIKTLKNVLNMLAPNGILITDTKLGIMIPENFKQIAPGILQRIK